jgi:tRNA-2-methylthio-N6-dimethylallyladenosine synthase
MNRSHDAASYLRVLDRVRAARPDIAISGDFIVGFPGETDAEFEDTLKIVATVNYAQAYSFKYSPRPGTPAATMEGQVPAAVQDERLQRLQAALNAQQLAFNRATIGRRTTILIERDGKRPGQRVGKSPWLQSVHVETGAEIGSLVEVEIVDAGPNSLHGVTAAFEGWTETMPLAGKAA